MEDGLELAIDQVFSDVDIDLNLNFKFPDVNSGSTRDIKMSSYAKELIPEFYEEDFKRFGYER